MKHAREDYNRIQDPAGLIPDDEPVFLVRGQDICGPYTVDRWADFAEASGCSPEIVRLAREQSRRMREWHRHKAADLPTMAAE